MSVPPRRLGATPTDYGCYFEVWAPKSEHPCVHLIDDDRFIAMKPIDPYGHFAVEVANVSVGARYFYQLDDRGEWPDPASRSQPQGVNGPSAVCPRIKDSHFAKDPSVAVALEDLVLYELHIGTFTPEGTFDSAIKHLHTLRALGITAIELMPVAQFSGKRNWGYDGVYPYAVQNSYGGAEGLCRLVSAAHSLGLAVHLDVVYNHLGPEGNHLSNFGYYFTNSYRTPWGEALNFDGPHSDPVRRFFIEQSLEWVEAFHLDGLRLDAVQAIFDRTEYSFIEELNERINSLSHSLGREVLVIAECDANDPRMVQKQHLGGVGLDAVWSDDFHHSLHAIVTQERNSYYSDYGDVRSLADSWKYGAAYRRRYSDFHQRTRGRETPDVSPARYVVFSQNHDQVGNRPGGERLTTLTAPSRVRLSAAITLLSPHTPLLFMGEEHGETAPFLYFIDHSDPGLVDAVRRGRARELKQHWNKLPRDPAITETFALSTVDHDAKTKEPGLSFFDFYSKLLATRARLKPLNEEPDEVLFNETPRWLIVRRAGRAVLAFNLGEETVTLSLGLDRHHWALTLSSENTVQPSETVTLAPWGFAVYEPRTTP